MKFETRYTHRDGIPRRGVYILPSALTTGNIFCGFYAVTSAALGDIQTAAVVIGLSVLLDGFDGRIARLTGATSQFGLQLDSLADAISFGIAPAFLLWAWKLKDLTFSSVHLGWIACFLFMVCGVMRLARFNVQSPELKHFVGLPIPGGAGVLAAMTYFTTHPVYRNWSFFQSSYFPWFLAILTTLLGLSMVSTLRYPSFKSLNLKAGHSYLNILLLAVIIAGIRFFSHEVLLALASVYFLSGIAATFRRKFFPRTSDAHNSNDKEQHPSQA